MYPNETSELSEQKPRMIVFGVGGGGSNAVDNMIAAGLKGVEFVTANTDAQALSKSKAPTRIQLGKNLTMGLGAGGKPDVGAGAAIESKDEILEILDGAHMVFVTAGMGGGTGTGAAPVICNLAHERRILTVAVITKPFAFEGPARMSNADDGIAVLREAADTLIVVPNQNLFRVAPRNIKLTEAFKMADEVLDAGVRAVTDLMINPGLINLDFADVKTVMENMGTAMMGAAEAEGPERARIAAANAIRNPLLSDVSLRGAKAVLINITGGDDISLQDLDQAVNQVRSEVDRNAMVIFGSSFEDNMDGRLRVSVVATGMDNHHTYATDYADEMEPSAPLRPTMMTPPQYAEPQPPQVPVVPPGSVPLGSLGWNLDDEAEEDIRNAYRRTAEEATRPAQPGPRPDAGSPQGLLARIRAQFAHQPPTPPRTHVPSAIEGSPEDDELNIPSFLRDTKR
jgi:cell division protein FtsZ